MIKYDFVLRRLLCVNWNIIEQCATVDYHIKLLIYHYNIID